MGILNNYKILFKSVCCAVILSLICLFVLSVILAITSVKENIMSISIVFISALSILISSFYASKKIKEKGIISGAIIGFLYMLILYIISSIVNGEFSMALETIIMIISGIIGGAIGGILGVNLR